MDPASNPSEDRLAQAQRENAELQQLLYAAVHDLKQPLRTISTHAELLKRQCAENQGTGELTSIIIESVHDMTTLIEDLLKYSRAGKLSRRTVIPLSSIMQWAVANLQKSIRESDARILYGDLPEISVDESQFVQVVQELLSNAIKFRGPEKPLIEVTAEPEAETYVISVRDNGQGIDARFHDQIFQPFKRLHGKQVPGSGLGLALSKKIVQAHGGKIWVESDGTNGSIFKFTVPV